MNDKLGQVNNSILEMSLRKSESKRVPFWLC